jgi:DNA-binding ferritin-like protein (Dps family)
MDSRQAAVEGVASCIFINKQSGTITLTPDTTSDKATLIKIEIDEEVSLPEYVQFFLSENLEDYVGSKLDYITQEDICNLPVVLPSLQAQRVICNYLSNLEKYKQAIQEKSRRLSQIKPLDVTPSQLLGHSLSLLEESVLQLTSKTGFLPSPISQALSALETNDNSKRFLCSQYIIEALIQFHVVTSSSFAIRILGQNKLEDAYKSFQNSKWQVSLTTWKNIFDKQVNEFEKSLKNTKSLQANPALVAFGDEGYFAFSGLFSRGVLSVFNRLIDMRNEYFGHPATPSAETMELYANNVSREINAYLDQTKTLWKWLAVGICKEVVTNESHELIASMDEFSGSFRNGTHLTITVPAGLLARNSLVFYPRNNPNPETVVQGIPFTFIDRISSTVHGLYFFSRLDKEGKLVFQSYSELKESTKRFEREDPRISLLSKRIFVSQAVPDPATPTNLK